MKLKFGEPKVVKLERKSRKRLMEIYLINNTND